MDKLQMRFRATINKVPVDSHPFVKFVSQVQIIVIYQVPNRDG